MAKKALTRKQLLKEPDGFISFSGRLIEFGRQNQTRLLVAVGSLLALLLVVVAVNQVTARSARQASDMVEKTMTKYAAALADTDAQTAYDRVKPDFEALFDQHGGTPAANVARIVYGDISYAAGDAETAIVMYERALKDFEPSPALKNLVISGLAHANQLKQAYPASIQYYTMLADGDDATLKSDALFNLFCLYQQTGEAEKSRAMADRLIADFPGSPYESLISEKAS